MRLGEAQLRAGNPQAQDTLAQGVDLAGRRAPHEPLIHAALALDVRLVGESATPTTYPGAEAAVAVVDPADVAVRDLRPAARTVRRAWCAPIDGAESAARRALALADAHHHPTFAAPVCSGDCGSPGAPRCGPASRRKPSR